MNDLELKQVCQNKAELMQTMMGTAAQFSAELIIGPDDHVAGMSILLKSFEHSSTMQHSS